MNLPCRVPAIRQHIRLFAIIFLSSLARNVAAQQVRLNLTGTWKRSLTKSTPPAPHHSDDWLKITHREPRLSIAHSFDGRTQIDYYVIDGKEHLANISGPAQDGEVQGKTYWDGDTLVIEKQQEIVASGSGFGLHSAWTSRYTLSRDGQILTVNIHVKKSSFGPGFDQSITYQKKK